MDKETRNAIERATQQARKLLEEDFATQLEGDFDVHLNGAVSVNPSRHLSARQAFERDRIIASIAHKRAAGMGAADSVRDYLRDSAFTTLNRFVALKMLEARELVQECISKGEESIGYREFCGMAPGLALLPDSVGYRLYIESLFDELSTEVKVLFDRRDWSSVLWPKRITFEQLLGVLNDAVLASVWSEDETIGWVYQYFNGQDERRKMREESQAPRNSRELAVRNQFFTPRYVVQFLTDNTLGRIWYEMRQSQTALASLCKYMILGASEQANSRRKKDPRDLHLLDPACGSGHFLLYAFDLFISLYEEAYLDPTSPGLQATGRTLSEDYPTLKELKKALPALILENNLHGVDIDPRCAQIAQLALWMRAQRAYQDYGLRRHERPKILRSNIIIAEPLGSDDLTLREFLGQLDDSELRRIFGELIESLNLAGEAGSLIPVERICRQSVRQGETGALFSPSYGLIRTALEKFIDHADFKSPRKRMFVEDADHGLGLLELAAKRFDVIIMNPPFGECSKNVEPVLANLYPSWNRNLVCSFIARSSELSCPNGLIGAVVDRTIVNKSTYEEFRKVHLLQTPRIIGMADLGWGVLDANVEVAALVLTAQPSEDESAWFVDVRESGQDRDDVLRKCAETRGLPAFKRHDLGVFRNFPSYALVYDLPPALLQSFAVFPTMERRGLRAYTGHQLQSSRHFFLRWEVKNWEDSGDSDMHRRWRRLYNGGMYSRFLYPHCEIVRFGFYADLDPRDVTDYTFVLRNRAVHGQPGVAFGVRGEILDAHVVDDDFVFTVEGQIIPISDDRLRYFVAGFLNSTVASRLLNSFCGQHKYSGYLNYLPCPDINSELANQIAVLTKEACTIKQRWFACRESCDWFSRVPSASVTDFDDLCSKIIVKSHADESRLEEILIQIDFLLLKALGADEYESLQDIQRYRAAKMPREDLKKMFLSNDDMKGGLAKLIISQAVGFCFGHHDGSFFARWAKVFSGQGTDVAPQLLSLSDDAPVRTVQREILSDDSGHDSDIATRVDAALDSFLARESKYQLFEALQCDNLRIYFSSPKGFFSDHLQNFSDGSRKAPIYWQLATPTGSFSVWLYIHALGKDSLFRVQNDYVAPKLLHEERRVEVLAKLNREGGASQRKELSAQEAFVCDLRVFLEEVKRVAPLWNPNLDDGVIINFAPLWRLVPHHKAWQKELKATWDALCEGKYDWAHLAMHLWPERVVPKCAEDRSLAIAHGLEEMFWVEGADGKWASRKSPTRTIDELVRERTSPAVKSALRSLMEASVASGSTGRKGRNRKASAVTEGGYV